MKKKYHGHANKGGVYKIVNLLDKKMYIGSCKAFKVRVTQHHSALKSRRHHNKHLQHAWNKHGEDSFLFEVLQVVEGDKKARTAAEQKHFDECENWTWTYNFKQKADCKDRSCFSKTPEESSKRRSKASKAMWEDPERRKAHSDRMKKVWSDPTYKDNIRQKMSERTCPEKAKQKIAKLNKGKKGKAHPKYGYKHSAETRKKQSIGRSRGVLQMTLEGEVVAEFSSAKKAAEVTGAHRSAISQCCHGKIETAGGYKWMKVI